MTAIQQLTRVRKQCMAYARANRHRHPQWTREWVAEARRWSGLVRLERRYERYEGRMM
jgi:hypothetical protein